jgi:glycosyltransferase involved in cell wall biosynthesis
MKFSVIIPSFLGVYSGAATNRESKIIRAVDSVLSQTYKDFEVIIIADGCERTFDLICDHYKNEDAVQCYLIHKQPIWSGQPRQFGISKAQGDYIVYLDIDDRYGENHLQKISDQLLGYDWVCFNDWLLTKEGGKFEREIFINQKWQNGTSNICHKRELRVLWGQGYGEDDWGAVRSLLKYPNHAKISTPEYFVCHIPDRVDV